MRKNYFFAVLFMFAMVTVNAQFAMDDMESYGGGGAPINTAHWTSWDGSDGIAMQSVSTQAQSGALSGYVDDSGAMDPVLKLGNKIFGEWGVRFSMYIPSGNVGYYNLQGTEVPGTQWVVGNIYLGNSGIGGDDYNTGRIDWSTSDEADDTLFTFPNDVWFDIIMNFDFTSGAGAATWTLWVDGVEVVAPGTDFADGAGTFAQSLGGINFYSINNECTMFIDDVEYINAFYTLGVNDLDAKGFVAFPNPVSNVLNLKANEAISSVSIINILGQEVYSSSIDALNATIDMSNYASGAYFVRVNINGTEGIVKIVK